MTETQRSPVLSLRYLFFDFVRFTAAIPGLLLYRPKTIYLDPAARGCLKEGALLISNHIGFVDPIYLQLAVWYRRHHFICAKEFFDKRFTALLFRGFLCIPVDRADFNMRSFRTITEHLQRGDLVSMFPEGHVNQDERALASFKSGMVLMALRSGRPIVPIYVGKRRHFYDRLTAVIGQPLRPEEIGGERMSIAQIEAAAELLHRREQALKDYLEKA